jgi:hypothetical protein
MAADEKPVAFDHYRPRGRGEVRARSDTVIKMSRRSYHGKVLIAVGRVRSGRLPCE